MAISSRVCVLLIFRTFSRLITYPIASFADGQLTDALRQLAGDRTADKRVQKKLKLVLISWHEQFQTDPSMRSVSDLYLMVKDIQPAKPAIDPMDVEASRRRAEKDEAKRKAKLEKAEARRKEEEERLKQKQMKNKPKRAPFNFEQVRVLASLLSSSSLPFLRRKNLRSLVVLWKPHKLLAIWSTLSRQVSSKMFPRQVTDLILILSASES